MFDRAHRLRSSREIQTVFKRGSRSSAGAVSCFFVNKPGSVVRITVIVDSKVAKKAVDRNLLKRRTRAALREMKLPVGDLIVRIRSGALEKTYSQLAEDLERCLSRL